MRKSYVNWVEEHLARREEQQGKQITKALNGRRKPPDRQIIEKLKEKTRNEKRMESEL